MKERVNADFRKRKHAQALSCPGVKQTASLKQHNATKKTSTVGAWIAKESRSQEQKWGTADPAAERVSSIPVPPPLSMDKNWCRVPTSGMFEGSGRSRPLCAFWIPHIILDLLGGGIKKYEFTWKSLNIAAVKEIKWWHYWLSLWS